MIFRKVCWNEMSCVNIEIFSEKVMSKGCGLNQWREREEKKGKCVIYFVDLYNHEICRNIKFRKTMYRKLRILKIHRIRLSLLQKLQNMMNTICSKFCNSIILFARFLRACNENRKKFCEFKSIWSSWRNAEKYFLGPIYYGKYCRFIVKEA